jgi:hypothetical protein
MEFMLTTTVILSSPFPDSMIVGVVWLILIDGGRENSSKVWSEPLPALLVRRIEGASAAFWTVTTLEMAPSWQVTRALSLLNCPVRSPKSEMSLPPMRLIS